MPQLGSIPPANPLSYEGQVVVPFISRDFNPQTTFNTFPVPTVWINTSTSNAYILVSKALGVAIWAPIGGSPGELDTITTPDSTVVIPTAANINFLNGTGMNITGSGSSVTFNASSVVPTTFNADSGSAVPSSNTLTISGSSTGLTTTGSGSTIGLTGTLVVGHGGTGLATITAHSVLVGNGTSAVALAGPNASSNAIFMAQGVSADPIFTTSGTPYVTGISFDSGSNTLSNYVQAGIWTPGFSFGGGTTGITYSSQVGRYTRIGNAVFFSALATLSSKGSSTGVAAMTGFPISAASAPEQCMPIANVSNLTFDGTNIAAFLDTVGTPGTVFGIYEGPSALAQLTDANFANNTRFETNGFYFVS